MAARNDQVVGPGRDGEHKVDEQSQSGVVAEVQLGVVKDWVARKAGLVVMSWVMQKRCG